MFYLSMIVFGLGQHMALFNTISSGLIAIRPEHFLQFESSLIFMSCLLGLVFCFPIATEVSAWSWKISEVSKIEKKSLQKRHINKIFSEVFFLKTPPPSTNNIYVMASFFPETSEFLWITLLCNKKHFFQFGAFVVYFFDYTIGSGWWMMVLYVLQLCAIFVIRGKPYSGEQVATALITKAHCCSSALIPLLAFSWHVVSIFFFFPTFSFKSSS